LEEKVAATVYKIENTAVGILHADHMAPSHHQKLVLTSPTSGSRSVGIVSSRTKATEFFLKTVSHIVKISRSSSLCIPWVEYSVSADVNYQSAVLEDIRNMDRTDLRRK
jgi:hypothetical protein